jgi:hypothetical protein
MDGPPFARRIIRRKPGVSTALTETPQNGRKRRFFTPPPFTVPDSFRTANGRQTAQTPSNNAQSAFFF